MNFLKHPKELEKKKRKEKKSLRLHLDMNKVLIFLLKVNANMFHPTRNIKFDEGRKQTSTCREIFSTCSAYCGKAWTIFCKSRVDISLPSLDKIKECHKWLKLCAKPHDELFKKNFWHQVFFPPWFESYLISNELSKSHVHSHEMRSSKICINCISNIINLKNG